MLGVGTSPAACRGRQQYRSRGFRPAYRGPISHRSAPITPAPPPPPSSLSRVPATSSTTHTAPVFQPSQEHTDAIKALLRVVILIGLKHAPRMHWLDKDRDACYQSALFFSKHPHPPEHLFLCLLGDAEAPVHSLPNTAPYLPDSEWWGHLRCMINHCTNTPYASEDEKACLNQLLPLLFPTADEKRMRQGGPSFRYFSPLQYLYARPASEIQAWVNTLAFRYRILSAHPSCSRSAPHPSMPTATHDRVDMAYPPADTVSRPLANAGFRHLLTHSDERLSVSQPTAPPHDSVLLDPSLPVLPVLPPLPFDVLVSDQQTREPAFVGASSRGGDAFSPYPPPLDVASSTTAQPLLTDSLNSPRSMDGSAATLSIHAPAPLPMNPFFESKPQPALNSEQGHSLGNGSPLPTPAPTPPALAGASSPYDGGDLYRSNAGFLCIPPLKASPDSPVQDPWQPIPFSAPLSNLSKVETLPALDSEQAHSVGDGSPLSIPLRSIDAPEGPSQPISHDDQLAIRRSCFNAAHHLSIGDAKASRTGGRRGIPPRPSPPVPAPRRQPPTQPPIALPSRSGLQSAPPQKAPRQHVDVWDWLGSLIGTSLFSP